MSIIYFRAALKQLSMRWREQQSIASLCTIIQHSPCIFSASVC